MNLKHLLAAAAATALMAGAAHAQTMTQPADSTMAPMTTPAGDPMPSMDSTTTTETSVDGTTSTSVTTPMATTGATTDTAATVTTTTVTNGPVADTPENRAKYKPLSHAGNRSAPKGN
ncbi:hypothetical protein JKL49_08980 [Phenylobacterium sp. 20VBR1]|uniref:Proteophosphoglycan ppg4 n=1 Tax=Phenylobacterium glaciei TaxID=2803784 RepID=A0A941HW75_9CAUL|nr:hypothetical protein [Phenylobacterium glaciei]MBR7619518.1 hypothetical protein [Phenylobacterium glaciei]QQZ51842.1 hypothetical protein JKL49_13780 [Phenylobacterium glaciei]